MSTNIDWRRIAAPQADGYDTDIVVALASSGPSLLRPMPWQRRAPDGAPTLFGGRVAIRNRAEPGLAPPRYAPAAPDHPHLAIAEALLDAWPEAAAQVPRLLDTIEVYTDTSMPPDIWLRVPGSSSHSLEAEFGTIMVTIDSPIALAQAIVHEMAHHKLRALGVSLEQAQRLITNDPAALYRSPIITTRRRPMTAVLHAQYSFIHVTALDVAIHDATATPADQKRLALFLLARNVPRMEAGFEEIRAHVQTDANGAVFIDAFMTWSSQVLTRARAILEVNGFGTPAL
ncbi:aKG-HExxH-type peptide beta-hydroxylase [Bradyrhizobium oligotrophicum]|uniref:aKG-HExxH-type peptide beta-hydroxylase n=1 Tax=Bradyrhizobium oligotrophicum TaxID=44255 RepID=UPI003EBAA556